jgi:hypothetical protein
LVVHEAGIGDRFIEQQFGVGSFKVAGNDGAAPVITGRFEWIYDVSNSIVIRNSIGIRLILAGSRQ